VRDIFVKRKVSVFIHPFARGEVIVIRNCLKLAQLRQMELIAFTPIGYPADNAGPKKRKPLDKLVRYIT
jgi:hypothetical protein